MYINTQSPLVGKIKFHVYVVYMKLRSLIYYAMQDSML